jgi:outer membrane protein assembly factor BamB
VNETTGLPTEFGPQKNVIWKTPLPPGHSSPILVGDRIFVTAYDGDKLVTYSLDRASGKILWRREAFRDRKEPLDARNSAASPSPVSDGKNLFVFFGDYSLVSYGLDGNERWRAPSRTSTASESRPFSSTTKSSSSSISRKARTSSPTARATAKCGVKSRVPKPSAARRLRQ